MPKTKLADDQSFQPFQDVQEQKGNYSVITYQTRIKLIQKVSNQGYSILKAAKQLQIKPSTAKYIYRCFRTAGRIMKKQQKLKKILESQKQKSKNGEFTNNSGFQMTSKTEKQQKLENSLENSNDDVQLLEPQLKQKQTFGNFNYKRNMHMHSHMRYWDQFVRNNHFYPIFTPYGYYLTPTRPNFQDIQNLPFMPQFPLNPPY